jgi:hypothetical protein
VDKDPKNATYQTHLGLAYAKNGDMLKARETLGNALKADPNAHGADEARKILGASSQLTRRALLALFLRPGATPPGAPSVQNRRDHKFVKRGHRVAR